MKTRFHPLRQAGAFAIEFGLVALFFFTLVFTIIEVSRALYMWNTLQEVTRRAARAAAITDLSDAGAISQLKREAVFRATSGTLALGAPITDAHIKIDYMALQTQPSGAITPVVIPDASRPSCPARNRVTCTADSGAANCVRLVRVRVCNTGGGECAPVPYQTILPLVNFPVDLPTSTTIVKAESLGYTPGMPLCE